MSYFPLILPNSFGTGWTKLSVVRDSDDVQLLHYGSVHAGWRDLLDKRLENAGRNYERTLSFVLLVLVVSSILLVTVNYFHDVYAAPILKRSRSL